MDQTYRQRTGKIICYVILVCLAALIQNTSGLSIEIGGARCFLLLPVCMMIGIGEDERTAALIALSAACCGIFPRRCILVLMQYLCA